MKQIIETTDGKFIGLEFEEADGVLLDGVPFHPDKVTEVGDGIVRYANSNYVIDAKGI